MTDILTLSRAGFLADVAERVPHRWRGVDFAGILDQVINWSTDRQNQLEIRPPGDQNTVSFALKGVGHVLWAAYPRTEDGAKFVVLPQIYPRLAERQRGVLLSALQGVSPNIRIGPRQFLQVPMYTVATDTAMVGFLKLLGVALTFVRTHSPTTA
jgi:hypothetical protein